MPKRANGVNADGYAMLKKHRPLFQKRHYEAITKAIAELYRSEKENYELGGPVVEAVFRIMFEKDNPNFDTHRFLAAIDKEVHCGPS